MKKNVYIVVRNLYPKELMVSFVQRNVITNIEMRVGYIGGGLFGDQAITFELGKNFKNLENHNFKIACEYSGEIDGKQQTLYRDAEMAITSGEFNLTPASSGYLQEPDRIYYINIGYEAEAL